MRIVRGIVRIAIVTAGLLSLPFTQTGPGRPAGPAAAGRADGRLSATSPWVTFARSAVAWGSFFLAAAAVVAVLVIASGLVPIKASSGHWAITAWILKFTMQRSVATHSLPIDAPPLDSDALVLKGAGHYDLGCRPCHGAPGQQAPRIARHMTPHPPDLRATVPNYDAAALFYIVRHGVKFTGMPAWPARGRDDEVWAMVAFLQRLPSLEADGYQRLIAPPAVPDSPRAPLEDLVAPRRVPPAIEQSCARCHEADGSGRGAGVFPVLAGQRPVYLRASLRSYATGDRQSGIMGPIAAGLSAAQIAELADYYAEIARTPRPMVLGPAEGRPGTATSPELVALGRRIAADGLPDRMVPPCSRCHGPGGPPRNPHYPSIAGQYADYLELQLRLFRSRERGGTAYHHIMERVAGGLTDEQIRAVAEYYARIGVGYTAAMADITVTAAGPSAYRVTVQDGGSRTEHEVTVTPEDVARYAPGVGPERLLTASFEFLLEREPKESILPRFALPVIERYFPEYARVIGGMVGGGEKR